MSEIERKNLTRDLCGSYPQEEKSRIEEGTVSAKALQQESRLCVQGQTDWSGVRKEKYGKK